MTSVRISAVSVQILMKASLDEENKSDSVKDIETTTTPEFTYSLPKTFFKKQTEFIKSVGLTLHNYTGEICTLARVHARAHLHIY